MYCLSCLFCWVAGITAIVSIWVFLHTPYRINNLWRGFYVLGDCFELIGARAFLTREPRQGKGCFWISCKGWMWLNHRCIDNNSLNCFLKCFLLICRLVCGPSSLDRSHVFLLDGLCWTSLIATRCSMSNGLCWRWSSIVIHCQFTWIAFLGWSIIDTKSLSYHFYSWTYSVLRLASQVVYCWSNRKIVLITCRYLLFLWFSC